MPFVDLTGNRFDGLEPFVAPVEPVMTAIAGEDDPPAPKKAKKKGDVA